MEMLWVGLWILKVVLEEAVVLAVFFAEEKTSIASRCYFSCLIKLWLVMIVLCIFQPVYKTERRLMLFLQPLEFLFFFFFGGK